jgi:hypothetical protein
VQSLLDLNVLRSMTVDREARLRRTTHLASERPRRRVRRWVGHRLMRLGARLAAEPILRPVRAR